MRRTAEDISTLSKRIDKANKDPRRSEENKRELKERLGKEIVEKAKKELKKAEKYNVR